ncbi:divalent-cation tolerance protein CutA [Actinosynnema sp. CA-299493]
MKVSADVCEVVITAPDPEWLATFCRRLLADRLCAAVHTFEAIRSDYWWKGELYDVGETRVVLHTRTSLVPRIVERVEHEHPYEVACVAELPIVGGNPKYLKWILDETTPEG